MHVGAKDASPVKTTVPRSLRVSVEYLLASRAHFCSVLADGVTKAFQSRLDDASSVTWSNVAAPKGESRWPRQVGELESWAHLSTLTNQRADRGLQGARIARRPHAAAGNAPGGSTSEASAHRPAQPDDQGQGRAPPQDAARGVTGALGDDLGMDAGLEQLRRVRMAQVVEATGQLRLLEHAPTGGREGAAHHGQLRPAAGRVRRARRGARGRGVARGARGPRPAAGLSDRAKSTSGRDSFGRSPPASPPAPFSAGRRCRR
jgi:hypothetical protein